MIQRDSPSISSDVSSSYAAPFIGAELTLSKLEENVNGLCVSFLSSQFEMESKTVDFQLRLLTDPSEKDISALYQEMLLNRCFKVADVYPLNGRIKTRPFAIKDFIRPIHRKEIEQQIVTVDAMDPERQWVRCLVIDFKDHSGRYNLRDEIVATEKRFAAFFSGDSADKKNIQLSIYNLIKKNRINFFINEGSLKADLLANAFTPEQAAYLQKSDSGPGLFCQLCEVIMNGFKQGCETVVNGHHFRPNDYISATNAHLMETIDLTGHTILSTPSLVTFYPHYYQGLYSETSEYYRLITTLFEASHRYVQSTSTTIITIE